MSLRHNARADERTGLILSTLAFFFVMVSYYIARPVRDQLGGALGSRSLPLIYAVTFASMILLAPVFGWLVANVSRRRLLAWSYSFFLVCLLAFVPAFMVQEQIGARLLGVVFYVWVSVFNLFVVSLFWSFMADIFASQQARRGFPLIALGGMGGAITGSAAAKVLVHIVGVAPLLTLSAAMLGSALALLLRLSMNDEKASGGTVQGTGGSLWAGVRELWSRPFLRYMAMLMVLGDGIGTLAYALMADYTNTHFQDKIARTDFYSSIDLATNMLGALLQLTLTRWLLVRFGAGWGLVLPALINVVLLLMVAVAGTNDIRMLGMSIPMLAVMLATTRGFAYGMTKPAVDALYTRVPRETRYKGKNFVETAVWRFGDVLVTSGVSVLTWFGVGVGGMGLIGAGIAATSAWVARRAGRAPDLASD